MKNRICVPTSMISSFQEFFDSEGIAIEIVADQPCDIEVIKCADRKESDLSIIYSGGWITCQTARDLAKRTGISLDQMGKLLDWLEVKIRRCSLGCFK